MTGKFCRLRGKMRERNITQADMAAALGCSSVCISQRLCCVRSWQLDEIWKVMNILHINPDEMYLYFPADGIDK